MMRTRCRFLPVAAVLATATIPASAATVYSYTGVNFFSFIDDPIIAGQYDTSHRITGWFVTESPLAANTAYFSITSLVTNFQFSDGRNTLSPGNGTSGGFAAMVTDNSGNIVQWNVALQGPEPTALGEQQGKISSEIAGSAFESGQILQCFEVQAGACVRSVLEQGGRAEFVSSGGTWSASTVPLPAALWMLFSGLGGIAFGKHAWRQKRGCNNRTSV